MDEKGWRMNISKGERRQINGMKIQAAMRGEDVAIPLTRDAFRKITKRYYNWTSKFADDQYAAQRAGILGSLIHDVTLSVFGFGYNWHRHYPIY